MEDKSILDEHRILTTAEAAKLLGFSAQSLRADRHYGRWNLPYVKLGSGRKGRCGYRLADIIRWIESRTFTNTSQETVAAQAHGTRKAASK